MVRIARKHKFEQLDSHQHHTRGQLADLKQHLACQSTEHGTLIERLKGVIRARHFTLHTVGSIRNCRMRSDAEETPL